MAASRNKRRARPARRGGRGGVEAADVGERHMERAAHRPGRKRAMMAHLLPCCLCAAMMCESSSSENGSFFTAGSS